LRAEKRHRAAVTQTAITTSVSTGVKQRHLYRSRIERSWLCSLDEAMAGLCATSTAESCPGRPSGLPTGGTVAVCIRHPDFGTLFFAQPTVSPKVQLTEETIIYTASLSKQMTAACLALLVQCDLVDIESVLSRWLPELARAATAAESAREKTDRER
jgi:hypothetical protein